MRGTKFRAVETERKQRLNKVVAAAGYASRRKAEDIIREGRVRVNGQVRHIPAHAGFLSLPRGCIHNPCCSLRLLRRS